MIHCVGFSGANSGSIRTRPGWRMYSTADSISDFSLVPCRMIGPGKKMRCGRSFGLGSNTLHLVPVSVVQGEFPAALVAQLWRVSSSWLMTD